MENRSEPLLLPSVPQISAKWTGPSAETTGLVELHQLPGFPTTCLRLRVSLFWPDFVEITGPAGRHREPS
jgi:hypothetical protein